MRCLWLALVLSALGVWAAEEPEGAAKKPGTAPAVASTDWDAVLSASEKKGEAGSARPGGLEFSISPDAQGNQANAAEPSNAQGQPRSEKNAQEESVRGNGAAGNSLFDHLKCDFKLGFFYGDGDLDVHRDIAEGAVCFDIPGIPSFDSFKHHAEMGLDSVYVSGEFGLRWDDLLELTTSVNTNLERETEFEQTSVPTGKALVVPWYEEMYVLRLNKGTKGVITLNNEDNRILNFDQCLALPAFPGMSKLPGAPTLRFLVGWKYSKITSRLSPCLGHYSPLERRTLPGTIGWQNLYRNAIPFTTGFTMDQEFRWTAPYLGMRLTVGNPQKLPGQWYVEGKGAPYAWGDYKFNWNGAYEDGFFFVRSQQATNLRLNGYLTAVKGGWQTRLVKKLYVDVWSEYMHLNLEGSGHETQSSQNNFLARQSATQRTAQKITIEENLWSVGANLMLRF